MIFRILCGIVIVSGFAYGGFAYAESLKKRIRQLSEFCDGLSMLEFNVRYMNFPMAEALLNTGKVCGGAVADIFDRSAQMLSEDIGKSPGEAFCQAIDENRKELMISPEEIDILRGFSRSLGGGDRESEINNIKTAKLRLSSAAESAEEEVRKKAGMSRGIGILLGLFIVIVLF